MTTKSQKGKRVEAAEPKTVSVSVRLPVDLLERLDAHHARLAAALPGLGISRADTVRVLLTKALDEAEGGETKAKET